MLDFHSSDSEHLCARCDQYYFGKPGEIEDICYECEGKVYAPLYLHEIEERLESATLWVARCHEIACALKSAFPNYFREAVTRYGRYHGRVSLDSLFYGRAHVVMGVNHGWLEMPDGTIIDPTRWVFEGCQPYVYHGPNDEEYDNEGHQLTQVRWDVRPLPLDTDSEQKVELDLTPEVRAHVAHMFQKETFDKLNIEQMFYLANAPYNTMQPYAQEIINAIDASDHRGLVPRGTRNLAFNRDSLGRPVA